MQIAIISEHASPKCALGGKDAGGQNLYVAQLAKHLVQFGHTVEVFTRRDSDELPIEQDLEEGFKLINVPAGPANYIEKEKLLPYMDEFSSFMISYIKSRSESFDVIHTNFWMSGLVGANLKKHLHIPFVITFHALGKVRRIHQGKNDGFSDERFDIEDLLVREADGIIAECPQDLSDLIELYDAHHKNVDIVPCGFDAEEMYPINKREAKKALGLEESEEVILHLGRMVPRKGADNVIRGFAQYLRENNKKAKLVIVGGETEDACPIRTPEIGRLKAIADQEGVSPYISFAGSKSRQKLKTYYSAADVFVTTPWYEPFGITPVESMACGTPVIGSNVGGIKYTVKHEKTGLLVPPNDPVALKEALSRIMQDEKLRKNFGMESLNRVNQHFRWEHMARKIEEILISKVTDLSFKNRYSFQYNREVLNANSESSFRKSGPHHWWCEWSGGRDLSNPGQS
ncbi:glycosyltransferase family 4 protein [Peredibacter sp. HCB2-198]|uniref:glycosyltransferase family 4 protein n=1 Tax=Peredibacter sp. HCB2-198 TaxID=3383025 RepID=UPI0038B5FF4E